MYSKLMELYMNEYENALFKKTLIYKCADSYAVTSILLWCKYRAFISAFYTEICDCSFFNILNKLTNYLSAVCFMPYTDFVP
jgi:hypothetical protein